ncbi:MAG: putative DNA modification/repair radical SAM protein [Spirochaetae bacterium HGW-Spirochaetae-7]|jgi:putative DNA modification/repair radical SAM protein|nr:MAG: putative DNA modification/repair radical SAM protein [Spirochaetae bacterium HGW-Spirochaetae-7]
MDTIRKLEILSDAAKYDASCSSSGSARPALSGGLGNGAVGGICHTWAADGRCVSLLKVLLSNACAWDCAYCVNRRSNDVSRAGFEPEELVRLVIDFYKRNYIEGAFLSSGVTGCPDTTMERLISVARTLRVRERWNGYLHLKAIPGASEQLVAEAARWADRVSVNIELPSAESLGSVAPDKSPRAIFSVMRSLARAGGFEPRRLLPTDVTPSSVPSSNPGSTAFGNLPAVSGAAAERVPVYDVRLASTDRPSVMEVRKDRRRNPEAAVLPAGQSTQLVVGASPESDAVILGLAENLYLAYDGRRVYYSAFVPTTPDPRVPALPGPPLLREHRLYQADWLFRFYGFKADEILSADRPFLDADLDPKCAWALRNLDRFPVDVNRADYLELLRVPGIGPRSASRILRARSGSALKPEALQALGVVMKRAAFFVTCSGTVPRIAGSMKSANPEAAFARAALVDGAREKLGGTQLEFDWDASA